MGTTSGAWLDYRKGFAIISSLVFTDRFLTGRLRVKWSVDGSKVHLLEENLTAQTAIKTQSVASAHALISRFSFDGIAPQSFLPTLVELAVSGSKCEGFLNSEIKPPSHDGSWTLIQRFISAEHTHDWRHSHVRKNHISVLEPMMPKAGAPMEESINELPTAAGVAMCITTEHHAGMDEQFSAWLTKIHATQASFPGYEGSYLQAPTTGTPRIWTTLLRFSGPESLDAWFHSKERAGLLELGKPLIASESIRRMTSSFPGWFPNDPVTGESPPNWKGSLLVLMCLYPVVMLQGKYCQHLFGDLRPSEVMFLSNIMSVAVVSFGLMPVVSKRFSKWLSPPRENRMKPVVVGTIVIVLMYLLENIIFWNF